MFQILLLNKATALNLHSTRIVPWPGLNQFLRAHVTWWWQRRVWRSSRGLPLTLFLGLPRILDCAMYSSLHLLTHDSEPTTPSSPVEPSNRSFSAAKSQRPHLLKPEYSKCCKPIIQTCTLTAVGRKLTIVVLLCTIQGIWTEVSILSVGPSQLFKHRLILEC